MTRVNEFDARFETCLRGLDLENPQIRVYPADYAEYKYFGSIVSRSFEGMGEAGRQSLVWGRILDALDDDDQRRIEFVYTNAPSEHASLSA